MQKRGYYSNQKITTFAPWKAQQNNEKNYEFDECYESRIENFAAKAADAYEYLCQIRSISIIRSWHISLNLEIWNFEILNT